MDVKDDGGRCNNYKNMCSYTSEEGKSAYFLCSPKGTRNNSIAVMTIIRQQSELPRGHVESPSTWRHSGQQDDASRNEVKEEMKKLSGAAGCCFCAIASK